MKDLCFSISRGKIVYIGVSIFDISKNIFVYEFYDTFSFLIFTDIINKENPDQIFIPEEINILTEFIKMKFKTIKLIAIPRKFYQAISNDFFSQSSINAYLSFRKLNFIDYKIKKIDLTNNMSISNETMNDLGLFSKEKSVLKFIDNTSTKMGKRLLIHSLLHPYTSKNKIQKRRDNVNFFLKKN